MPQPKVATRGEQLVDDLRADLLSGSFAPGAPLRLVSLAERFGTSVAVVREALLRLSEQHLVTLTPNAGFRVRDVSAQDLDDLTEVRVLVEGRAIVDSISRGDAAWESRVVATHHLLDRIPARAADTGGTSDEWARAHGEFHHALIDACGNERLLTTADALRDSAELYRQLSAQRVVASGRDVRAEHTAMRDAALDRRAEDARALLEDHLRATAAAIRPILAAE